MSTIPLRSRGEILASTSTAHDVYGSALPLNLLPSADGPMFPHPTTDDINHLRGVGYVGLGVAATIIKNGKLLVVEHVGSDRTREGAIGPVTETTKASGTRVESVEVTLQRG